MKKAIIALIFATFFTSCHRTSREMWEDTKSASRYVSKGMKSFMGRHVDSRTIASNYDWGDDENPHISLSDDDLYEAPVGYADLGKGVPISKESPGDPGSKIPGIEGFKNPEGMLASLFNNIHFDTDNYSLKGEENLTTLKTIADFLAKHPGTYVFVEGHADQRGAAAYNLSLSAKRANSVRSFLVQNGVNPDQLFTISYGKERPLAQGAGEAIWSQNRRAQFKLYER